MGKRLRQQHRKIKACPAFSIYVHFWENGISVYDPVAGLRGIDRFASMLSLSPPCPTCGKPVPFMKTQWGLGTPFFCNHCGDRLVISKNFWIGISALVAFWLLKGRTDSLSEAAMLIVGLIAAVLILSRLFLRPQKA